MIHRVKIRSIILSLIVLGLFVSSAMAVAPTLDAGTGTVNPTSGIASSTSFNFTATFTDASNHSLTGKVNVTIIGAPHNMAETNTSDVNTTDGKSFYYTTTLPSGTHTFNFSASDGFGGQILNANGTTTTVTVTNPALVLDSIGAKSIDAGTRFELQLSTTGGAGAGTYVYSNNATNLTTFSMSDAGKIDFTPVTANIDIHYVNISVTSAGLTDWEIVKFTINPPGASGGNRIWYPGLNNPYTWTAQSFTGFYYNIDDNITTEELEIKVDGRTINEGRLKYTTKPQSVPFEFGTDWGEYDVVGFMAEKYFAGYNADTKSVITSKSPSLLNDNMLSKVLVDDDEKYTLYQGDTHDLQEGYAIKINQLDINGGQVMLEILKDGKSVDTGIVKPDKNPTYAYKKDVGAVDKLPIIVLHIDSVFAGPETAAVTIDGLFQISSEYKSVEAGDKYGLMEVSSASRTELELENSKDISLSAGKTIDLFGDVKIKVADAGVVRFELTIKPTDNKTREIRGTVSESTNPFTWNPYNFEGFYYNLDEDVYSETMTITPGTSTIPAGKLVYVAQVKDVEFAYSAWKKFQVIGFMAEQYFAGYSSAITDNDITSGDDFSFVNEEMLSKVLIDTDEKYTLNQGDTLKLKEGYELKINQLDIKGNQVMLELLKDGKSIDQGFARAPDVYMYEKDVGKLDNVPIVIAHIQSVFAGTETSSVVVDGLFQISENYKTVESGATYDKMEVKTINSNAITMENKDSISLSKGKSTKILGNISLKVADSVGLRYYPFVNVAGSGSEAPNSLKISVPDKLYTDEAFIITVKSDGEPVKNAEIQFDGDVIGKTNSDGEIEYTATDGGTFEIIATKSGYTEASKEVDIEKIPESKKLQISISPDRIKENHAFTITVTSAEGNIKAANVDFDGKRVGETDSDGKINYTHDKEGTYKVVATKTSYLKASTDVTIVRPPVLFNYSNLTIDPKRVKPEKHAEITIDLENVGEINGTKTVEFKVNGEVVDSMEVTLNMTEMTNINFTYVQIAEGIYTIEVGDQTGELEVKATSILKIIVLAVMAIAVVGAGAGLYLVNVVGMSVDEIIAKIREMIESVR